jgi:hypothetical protein
MLRLKLLVSACLISLALPTSARAEERFYVLVFAAQAEPNYPRGAHTVATFVKATGEGNDPALWQIETRTISWLPASMAIVPRLMPERGRNFDLPTTLNWSRRQGARITVWGPYEIDRRMYEFAQRQITRLEGNAVAYRMVNSGLAGVSNCILAVGDVVPGDTLLTGTAYGEAASVLVARHYRRWMRNPEQRHEWVYERLGLAEFNVLKRT